MGIILGESHLHMPNIFLKGQTSEREKYEYLLYSYFVTPVQSPLTPKPFLQSAITSTEYFHNLTSISD